MYEIRIAQETDRELLVRFIDQHWRKNHIFVTCRELLDWQHLDQMRRRYNFVIGIEAKTQAIRGVLGFIPLAQFDSGIEVERFCWMAIWKIQDSARGQKLGRRLLSYLEDDINPAILSTVAASAMTLPMYQARGYQTGRLSHHFMLNPEKSDFHLVTMKKGNRPNATASAENTGKKIEPASESDIINETADCFLSQKNPPLKSPNYLVNRYLRHPFYRYQAYKIREGLKITGVIVTRLCSHNDSRAIRIIDFIGPSGALRGLQDQWTSLMTSFDAEYIDFYNAGIDEGDLLASGFNRREVGGELVIPNYFEPFSNENVEIDYVINTPPGQTYRIVKGDSDQDRPNLLGGT
jgi:hypothetical protein